LRSFFRESEMLCANGVSQSKIKNEIINITAIFN